jgi:2-oxoglutarate dehydrogenase E2 component (dihydrolipoamide succinyltransferase)
MSRIDVIMPQMGESIAEGTIVKWHKKIGDAVERDETLLEISTDKVDSEIPSPVKGILAEILVQEQQTVEVKTVIARIETDETVAVSAAAAAAAAPAPPAPATHAASPSPQATGPEQVTVRIQKEAGTAPIPGRFYSPLVLNIARTEGIAMDELERIPGTGEGGRVTKKDIQAYAAGRASGGARPAGASSAGMSGATPVDAAGLKAKYPPPGHEILQMSNVMQKMAQHMLNSVQTSPHVSAVHEVDMTAVVRHREKNAAAFEKREGFKLTFTPYIVEAVVKALKKYPLVNSSVEGDKIIRKTFINVGMAVASDSGLIVPVIKHAEEKNFDGLARAVNDLALRTRAKKLTPDDIQGGTFTISNFGVFGTMIGTPIISQPQVAILGTGAITKRPVVVEGDAIAIRSMAFFTLSFDHRIVDGALGGMFLEEIVKNLENFVG